MKKMMLFQLEFDINNLQEWCINKKFDLDISKRAVISFTYFFAIFYLIVY